MCIIFPHAIYPTWPHAIYPPFTLKTHQFNRRKDQKSTSKYSMAEYGFGFEFETLMANPSNFIILTLAYS